jgi:hypothetical protein
MSDTDSVDSLRHLRDTEATLLRELIGEVALLREVQLKSVTEYYQWNVSSRIQEELQDVQVALDLHCISRDLQLVREKWAASTSSLYQLLDTKNQLEASIEHQHNIMRAATEDYLAYVKLVESWYSCHHPDWIALTSRCSRLQQLVSSSSTPTSRQPTSATVLPLEELRSFRGQLEKNKELFLQLVS